MSQRKYHSTLKQLAELTGADPVGDGTYIVSGVDEIEHAVETDVAFIANPKYYKYLKTTKAGILCVGKDATLEKGRNYLISDNPSLTFQQVLLTFLSQKKTTGFSGIHPTATIHQSAVLEHGVEVGPYAVIDRDTKIGKNTKIAAHVIIGPACTIGQDCHLHARSVVREQTEIGNRVVIQPGAVIGSCGFGYLTDEMGVHHAIPQLGKVILEDDVEIGANTTVDRARFKTTLIKKGTKIDNLVQIGHNVQIGENNLIISQVGIAGSTKTGKNVVIAGQCGISGHLEIGDNVMLGGRSATGKSILNPGSYLGAPAIPAKDFLRQLNQIKRLGKNEERIKELERQLRELKEETAVVKT